MSSRAPEATQRWALAVLVFVDPCTDWSSPEKTVKGAKHLLLFSGGNAMEVVHKARATAAWIEQELSAGARHPVALEVVGELGPYLPTQFLGFQDIRWLIEVPADGAVIDCGPLRGTVGRSRRPFSIHTARWDWNTSGSWCLAEITVESERIGRALASYRECLMLVRANSADEAVQKTEHFAFLRSQIGGKAACMIYIRDISMIDDSSLEQDAAELLHYTRDDTWGRWRDQVTSLADLSILTGAVDDLPSV